MVNKRNFNIARKCEIDVVLIGDIVTTGSTLKRVYSLCFHVRKLLTFNIKCNKIIP